MKTVKQQWRALLKQLQDALLAYNTFAHSIATPQVWCAAAFTDAEKFWKEFDSTMLKKWEDGRKFSVATPEDALRLGIVDMFWGRQFPSTVMETAHWMAQEQLTPPVVITKENVKDAKKIAKDLTKKSTKMLNRVAAIAKKSK